MITHCLFCDRSLRPNRLVAALPVGREIAFDPRTGRVWVVCTGPRGCGRWNKTLQLPPSTLAELDRLYASAGGAHTAGRIGVARVRDGRWGAVRLVRVDPAASWREFASWRFGVVQERRHRVWLAVQSIGVVVIALFTFRQRLPFHQQWIWMPIALSTPALAYWAVWRRVLRLHDGSGVHAVRVSDGFRAELETNGPAGPRLTVPHARGISVVEGAELARALAVLLPAIEFRGGTAAEVDAAVLLIVERGGPEAFTADVAWPAVLLDHGGTPPSRKGLLGYPRVTRLALEMAAHEARERQAAANDASELQLGLDDAEENAAICNDLPGE